MAELTNELRALIHGGPLAHLATINRDGSPQVTVIWIGLDGDDIVSGHLNLSKKIRNIQRDDRVVLSFDAPPAPGVFLAEHAVLMGRARVEVGGAWELLNRLGKVYVAAGFDFPAPKSEGGYVLRYAIEQIRGVGPWVPEAT